MNKQQGCISPFFIVMFLGVVGVFAALTFGKVGVYFLISWVSFIFMIGGIGQISEFREQQRLINVVEGTVIQLEKPTYSSDNRFSKKVINPIVEYYFNGRKFTVFSPKFYSEKYYFGPNVGDKVNMRISINNPEKLIDEKFSERYSNFLLVY